MISEYTLTRASTRPPNAITKHNPRPRPSRPNRKDSPPPPPLRRSPSSSSSISSSSSLLSLLHPERTPPSPAPIPLRLRSSPLTLCESSPFHKRSLSSGSTSSASSSPGRGGGRMVSLPEVEEDGEKSLKRCQRRSPEKMKVAMEGLLFPRQEKGRKVD